jgi:hypothetical protein
MEKLGYEALDSNDAIVDRIWRWFYMWKWKCSLKNRMFLWLDLANIIITWGNGQRMGWSGPNICTICNVEEESMSHFFVSCSFASQVWREVMMNLNCPRQWILFLWN